MPKTNRIALGVALGASLASALVYAGGQVLPKPQPPFAGKIGRTFEDSTPKFPELAHAPEGAPNVVLVLLDDVGFGHAGTFGGPVATPTLDHLAKEGLRYNRFHTTALCSPTRAALITGRNHHSVGMGSITEFATGYPDYDSAIPKGDATVRFEFDYDGGKPAPEGRERSSSTTPRWQGDGSQRRCRSRSRSTSRSMSATFG